MKTLAKVLLGALGVFLIAGMLQERRAFFAGAVYDPVRPRDPALEAEIEETLRTFLSISRHLYLSRGDERFAERLPAAEQVSQELLADVEYLRRNHRVQDERLVQLELLSADRVGTDFSTARTKEYWIVQTRGEDGTALADPVQSQVAYVEYQLARTGLDWQIARWDFVAPPGDAEGDDGAAPPGDDGDLAPGVEEP